MTTSTDARPGAWAQLKPLVLRLHFYAGVFIAPFILVAAATGLVYTAAPQIERAVYADQLTVEPGVAQLPLSEQFAAAREAHPDGALVEVRPPIADDSSTRVVFTDETVPTDYDMAVFVDPYTGEVLGQERTFGQWLGVRAWIDDLHRNLHLGAVGRNYSELAASWLWVVVLGGLALWFTKRRSDRRARRLLLPETSATGRRRTLSVHATVGVWVALGALLLSATGLTWSRFAGENIGEVRTALSWTGTSLSTSLGGQDADDAGGHGGHGGHGGGAAEAADDLVTSGVGIDGAVAAARASGLQDPLVVTPPADAETAWAVSENKRSAPTRFDSVAVDPQPTVSAPTSFTTGMHPDEVTTSGHRRLVHRRAVEAAGPRGHPTLRSASSTEISKTYTGCRFGCKESTIDTGLGK
ncbi:MULTISPECIES: PepSY-associated TM helix domain-containing protein [unclassified Aeromicrobium]|uniref:PepSY-associated TM helix domain-containing protein n=1 Tax=unclassified Aeromicrobium TaxID=2633570 RepID=UPI00288A6C88|nr:MULTISPECIES: PepSY-associated TM helix domain-containing protein [unclassified Aeromicrobium]